MSYVNYYSNSNILHTSLAGVMGTQLDMLMVGADKQQLISVWYEIEARLGQLELLMSRFDSRSELYRLNSSAKSRSVEVSGKLWQILSRCFDYYVETNGYFDISLGCRQEVDVDYVRHTVAFNSDNVYLDLGGYGKGYALEVIRDIAASRSVENLLVSFGNSSILAMGHHPSGSSWSLSTSDPYSGRALDRFELFDATLTVSGNTPSHPSHIYNPHSGIYNSERRMVAIVCDDPVVGEVLSTSGMLMDADEFEKLTKRYNIKERKIVEL